MGTDSINSSNAQQTDQQTIVTKAEAALAATAVLKATPASY
jgi:hypothetical protein